MTAVPIWPADLPEYLLVDGFSFAFANNRVQSKPDAGAPKVRRRSSMRVTPISGAFDGCHNDWLRLLDFYNHDLASGSLPFLMPDRLLDGQLLLTETGAPLLDNDGVPLLISSWWLVLFNAEPSFTGLGGSWFRVSFTINVLNI